MLARTLRRFPPAIQGILKPLKNDPSFKTEFFCGAVFLAAFSYIFWPLSSIEMLFLGLAYGNVLVTELQNSSFETALNALHPDEREEIGRSKDMAAGAVLLSGLFALFVVSAILFSRFS